MKNRKTQYLMDESSSIGDIEEILIWGEPLDQAQAIRTLAKINTPEAMQALIRQWSIWILTGYEPWIIDLAESEIKNKVTAIRPLVNLLEKGVEIDASVKDGISNYVLYRNAESVKQVTDIERKIKDKYKKLKEKEIWDRYYTSKDFINLTKKYNNLIQLAIEERQLQVRRQFAQLLSDTSDKIKVQRPGWEIDTNNNDVVVNDAQTNFIKYAMEPLARLLDKESDLEVRGCIANILKNINTPQALNVMTRAIRGEGQRFNMLDQYYLRPAREKGKEARGILGGVVTQAKNTLKMLQWMNFGVFLLGTIILALAVFMSFTNQNMGVRIAGALTGIGGLGGVIYYLIKAPLDRIQNSISNLAEIEAAFYTFIWDLDISDTYIQSQYVAKGVLSDEDIKGTIERISEICSSTIELIESYTVEGREPFIGRITALSPPIGQTNSEVSIKGMFRTQNGKKEKQIIALDHKPTLAKVTNVKTDEIRFIIPSDVITPEKREATVWVSVIDDGLETNCLPYRVIDEDKQPMS